MKYVVSILLLIALVCSYASGKGSLVFKVEKNIANPIFPDHALFSSILNKYVDNNGMVDYNSLQKNVKVLDEYLDQISSKPPKSNWTRQDSMAYWINAYNAFTIKLILDHYPLKSILDLYDGKPWSVLWIKSGDQTLSLDNIEHDILRPQFKDPRIHFAINCASYSCPPLTMQAFTAKKLDKMLTSQTTKFFNSPYNSITTSRIQLSKILDWYKGDFGDVHGFVSKYSKLKPAKNIPIEYLEYNWSLNEKGQ